MSKYTAPLLLLLAFALPPDLWAQLEPPVSPGDSVRIQTSDFPDGTTLEGTVARSSAAALHLVVEQNGTAVVPIPLESILALEVRTPGSVGTGIVLGGLMGAVGGLLTTVIYCQVDDNPYCPISGLVFVPGGVVVGGVIGGVRRRGRWESVPIGAGEAGRALAPFALPGPSGTLWLGVSIRL